MPSANVTDVWAAGALGTTAAAAFLSVSDRTIRTLARQEKWPRRYLGKKVLYPRASVAAYLAALPSTLAGSALAQTRRLRPA